MSNQEAIANLNMISVAFVEPVTKEQRKLIDDTFDNAIKALKQEPKAGQWKRISIDKYSEHAMYWYRCDRCGKDNLGNTDWCPNCGAKMIEPQESEVNNEKEI